MGTGIPRPPAAPRRRAAAKPAPGGPAAAKPAPAKPAPASLRVELEGSKRELERASERLHARECALTELRGLLERLEKSLEAANGDRDEADRRALAHAERVATLERDLTGQQLASGERDRERALEIDELRARSARHEEELETSRAAASAAAEKAAALREQLGVLRDEQARQLQLEEQELAGVRAELAGARLRIEELEATLAAERDARAQLLTCPRCAGPMDEFDHMGVTLDRCTRCEGLYFDAGELEEVIRREYDESSAAPAPAPRHVDDIDDEEDTLVDVAPIRRGFFRSLFARRGPGETPPTDGGNGAR